MNVAVYQTRWPRRLELVSELVLRELRLRYSGSVLGLGWSQLAALAQAGILIFVFGRVVRLGIPHYPAFVLVGMVPWLWFAGGIGSAASSVVSARDLVRRPGFPPAVLPLVPVGTALINFVLTVPITLITVLLVVGRISATVALLPLLMIVQLLVMLGPAYLVAALNVFLRDTGHLVGIFLGLYFYATPVFYEARPRPVSLCSHAQPHGTPPRCLPSDPSVWEPAELVGSRGARCGRCPRDRRFLPSVCPG